MASDQQSLLNVNVTVSHDTDYRSDASDDYGELLEDDDWLQDSGDEAVEDGEPAAPPPDLWGPQKNEYLRDNRNLYRIINRIQLFSTLDDLQKEQIMRELVTEEFADGEEIVRQGEVSDSRGEDQRFYIIVQGSAKLFKTAVVPQADGTVVEGAEEELVSAPDVQLGVGDYFGELALLHAEPRSATVVAVEKTVCKTLTKAAFKQAAGSGQTSLAKLLQSMLANIDLFRDLSEQQRAAVLSALRPAHYADGEAIMSQGEKGDRMYVITHGDAVITKRVEEFGSKSQHRKKKKDKTRKSTGKDADADSSSAAPPGEDDGSATLLEDGVISSSSSEPACSPPSTPCL